MPLQYAFSFPLSTGLHARPASVLADLAESFSCDIRLTNERSGTEVNARSVLSMIGADIRQGDPCRLSVSGSDEATAYSTLCDWINTVLPIEPPLPATTLRAASIQLSRCLPPDTPFISGTVLHPGIAQGIVTFLHQTARPALIAPSTTSSPEQEQIALSNARDQLKERMELQQAKHSSTAAEVFRAHWMILHDPAFLDQLQHEIQQGRTAIDAVINVEAFFTQRLAHGSDYIRERAIDLQEICQQLLHLLLGTDCELSSVHLTQPSILVADHLGPRQLLELNRELIKGLIIRDLNATSHAAILARAFDIPTLSGIAGFTLREGQPIILDGNLGLLLPSLTPAVLRYYQRETRAHQLRKERLTQQACNPAITSDGYRLDIAANISTAEETGRVIQLGADGIGLFRTEMIYLSQDQAPSEEAQLAIYRNALDQAAGKEIIIRTFDIGGDKPAPYLNLPKEDNPFLGYRGARIYPDYLTLFETQLRAILRASAYGPIRLLIPMISSVEEIRWVKLKLTQIRESLTASGIPFDSKLRIGVMIEIPSAACSIRTLSIEADFFSIGTNDLSQYFFATDRTNERVASLCSVRHPAFLRMLSVAVAEAQSCEKWIGLCGEMAADPINLPLLIGLGLNEISTSASAIPAHKQKVRTLSSAACRSWLEQSMSCSTHEEVTALLTTIADSPDERWLEDDLILLDSDSTTKEEVIREFANALYRSGRTDQPTAIEEAIWVREEIKSTGVGFEFGVPHCKSDALHTQSISIIRLKNPISWNPVEEEPVRMLILLAVRQSGSDQLHLKIFSKLARKLMHDEFRDTLLHAATNAEVIQLLEQNLGL